MYGFNCHLVLIEQNFVFLISGLRLSRGMSNAFINSKIVTAARGFLLKEAEAAMVAERGGGDDDDDGNSFVQTTGFTFMLPDLSIFPEDLKAFLYKDLVDSATLVSLEQAGQQILSLCLLV